MIRSVISNTDRHACHHTRPSPIHLFRLSHRQTRMPLYTSFTYSLIPLVTPTDTYATTHVLHLFTCSACHTDRHACHHIHPSPILPVNQKGEQALLGVNHRTVNKERKHRENVDKILFLREYVRQSKNKWTLPQVVVS